MEIKDSLPSILREEPVFSDSLSTSRITWFSYTAVKGEIRHITSAP
jgi:hypothetical protein